MVTGVVLLDIEKAFYKYSYLYDRSFEVKIGRATSRERNIKIGVTQGFVLGPLLFDLYIADVSEPRTGKYA